MFLDTVVFPYVPDGVDWYVQAKEMAEPKALYMSSAAEAVVDMGWIEV